VIHTCMNNFMQSEFSSVPVAFHPAGTSLLISDTQPDQNPKAANAGARLAWLNPVSRFGSWRWCGQAEESLQ